MRTMQFPVAGRARRRPATAALLAMILILAVALPAAAALDYPRPKGPVGDYAGVIPANYQKRIAEVATELWQKTGAAVVVATIPELGGESIEEAAVQLFKKWGIGAKGTDEGLLILVSVRERRLRIEVGYGLEGVITDAMAGAIRDQAMVPYLKKGQWGPGFLAGVSAAAGVIARAKNVALTGVPEVKVDPDKDSFGAVGLIFVLAMFFLVTRVMRRGGRGGGGLLTGVLLGSMMGGGSRGGGGGFGGFGGGFGGFGGGMSGGGGASGGF